MRAPRGKLETRRQEREEGSMEMQDRRCHVPLQWVTCQSLSSRSFGCIKNKSKTAFRVGHLALCLSLDKCLVEIRDQVTKLCG